ncbi:DUF4136 domain-containing protein [Shewanella sp. AS1]|uniref:DUF4136 domain-containing protein n=1 Tax=Shewanella sp. AS1 TaxID=2907626 RepID=UPI001F1DABEB|nr:DUF4136 domain-containing protein [Shewanella sp. AS1]MCE9678964.1 DUF4136 domain-containing protein [Shewanella sp. AS1]
MIRAAVTLCILFLLGACVTEPVARQGVAPKTERIMTVASGNLAFITPERQRFAFHPQFNTLSVDDTVDPQALALHIQEAIVDTMVAKGYQHVDSDDLPDFLIGYGVAFESQVSDAQLLQDTGMVAGLSETGVDMTQYDKSTMLLMLFAANEMSPRWKVLAQGFTDIKHHLDESADRLHHLMAKMLAPLPVLE